MKKETQCVQAGTLKDNQYQGLNSPLYTSTAYGYMDKEEVCYPRYFTTPNQGAVVKKICALEGAEDGLLFSSGMAAVSTTILAHTRPGDHVILLDDLYGGTHSMATADFERLGLEYDFVATSLEAIMAAQKPNTTMVIIESPTNPLMNILDIKATADWARENKITSLMDNTFGTSINQTPLALGIDIVVHSGTKYMGGHSDVCCGFALASKKKMQPILDLARHLGGSLDSFAAYLLERSLKTLAIRVERQCQNAQALAEFLEAHPKIVKVNYPGLPNFPGHDIAKKQMKLFGAMMSFELDESIGDVDVFLRKLKVIHPAVSLGGVESSICSPKDTSHKPMTAEERARVGISDFLLRLSIGIEHIDDLKEDIEQALT
ncbi:Cystathionine gamma-synthase [Desulfatibacillum aliphaticivorans]|uniref:cysteine-S-conjugate beta-lyase n=1 Tax=Desulfatibacillum aliphaticivorans TaxID=218208 RepID=B8FHY7_DESAL|nr:PLP-dependent aspartate aminotransferase family protein [Desulfatibacillum aliphaticivorans]ACL02554.1 Cystathionine gamma-synthase [Desulfatibacillum aliphaticivorans]